MDDNKPAEPSAEQLLKMLDLQLAASRERRAGRGGGSSRTTFRVGALVLVLAVLFAALWALSFLIEEMRPAQREGQPVEAVEPR